MESELAQSRWAMETELNSRFDCFKQLFVDTDSSFNSAQPEGQMQQFYSNFLKLKNSRDSIVNIEASLTKKTWMNILVQFSLKVTTLKGNESAKEQIEKDLVFLKANSENIPDTEFGELYKHIVERWTVETYNSVLSNAAIDFVEGYRPPCRF